MFFQAVSTQHGSPAIVYLFPGKHPWRASRYEESNHNTSGDGCRTRSDESEPKPGISCSLQEKKNWEPFAPIPAARRSLLRALLGQHPRNLLTTWLGWLAPSRDSSFFYDFMAFQLAQTDARAPDRIRSQQEVGTDRYPKSHKISFETGLKVRRSEPTALHLHLPAAAAFRVCFPGFVQHPELEKSV